MTQYALTALLVVFAICMACATLVQIIKKHYISAVILFLLTVGGLLLSAPAYRWEHNRDRRQTVMQKTYTDEMKARQSAIETAIQQQLQAQPVSVSIAPFGIFAIIGINDETCKVRLQLNVEDNSGHYTFTRAENNGITRIITSPAELRAIAC